MILGSRVVEPLVVVQSSQKLSPFRFIAGISADFEIVTPLFLPFRFLLNFFPFFMNIGS